MKTRIYNPEHTDNATLDTISTAISYENADMLIEKVNKRISTLTNWIEGKGQHEYSEAEIEGFKSEREKRQAEKAKHEKVMSEAKEVHDLLVTTVATATRPTADGQTTICNSETAIRNCLRLNAVWDDSSLMGYALLGTDNLVTEEFVKKMNSIHDPNKADENGMRKHSPEQEADYKKTRESLENYLGTLIALPVETVYNRKIKGSVLKNSDFAIIHDQYLTGVKNQFDEEHCTGQDLRFALRVGKNGTISATKFWRTVATQLQQYVC